LWLFHRCKNSPAAKARTVCLGWW